MRKKMFSKLLKIAIVFITVVLSGCVGQGKADLVPVKSQQQFCDIEKAGEYWNLLVHIKNQGDADAPGSEVTVEFYLTSKVEEVKETVGPIPKGQTVIVRVQIPTGCWNPDCNFKITVDSNNDIDESDEGNNSATGNCLG